MAVFTTLSPQPQTLQEWGGNFLPVNTDASKHMSHAMNWLTVSNWSKLSKLFFSVSVIFTMEIPKQSEKSQIGLVFSLTRYFCIDSSCIFIVIVSWWRESLLWVGCSETGTKRVLLGFFGDCYLDHSFGCLNFYGILFQCLNTLE